MSLVTLSPNGLATYQLQAPPEAVLVATVEGVVRLTGNAAASRWTVEEKTLTGLHIGSLMREPKRGYVFAGMDEGELYRSTDDARSWQKSMNGISVANIFSLTCVEDGKGGVDLYSGTEPAHLFRSNDYGASWQELPALRQVSGMDKWTFPTPPHVAHVKNVAFDPRDHRTLYVCIEQGALLKSYDGGESFKVLEYQDDSYKLHYDAHRIVFDPKDPDHIFLPSGDGIAESYDGGETFDHIVTPDMRVGYPDALFYAPTGSGIMFAAGGGGNPYEWLRTGNARSAIVRSADAGRTWRQVEGGLPVDLPGNVEAMTMFQWADGHYGFFAGTTDGEVFASFDKGGSWCLIAGGLPPVSKCEHYQALAVGRENAQKLARA
jgi:photosystem II stability/assembly factor-like uncharacterized protein